MKRYELAFTDQDREYQPIDSAQLSAVLSEIAAKCGGYARSRRLGYWVSPDGREYASSEILVITDAPDDSATFAWFRNRRTHWQTVLNYEQLYMVTYAVQWVR